MIVDLLRNDLGRISRPGSVTWADVFEVERYETVWQLTTTVVGRARRRASGSPTSSAGCSRADRSPARRRSARWRSSASSRTRLAGSTAARSGYLAPAGSGQTGRPVQRRDPHGDGGRRLDAPPSTGSAAGSRGTPTPGPSTRRRSRRLASSPPAARTSSSWRRCGSIRRTACGTSTDTSNGSRPPPTTSASGCDETEIREAVEKTVASAPAAACAGPARRSARTGRCAVVATPLASDPDVIRVAIDDVAPGSPRRLPVPQDVAARAVRGGAAPPSRRRRRRARQRPGRDHGVDDRERRRPHRRAVGHAAARRRAAAGDRARRRAGGGTLVEEAVTIEDARSAEEIALISDTRGWRRAVGSSSSRASGSTGKENGRIPCSSRGQSHSGHRGGSSYTSTVRSQYGQSPSRIAGGCPVPFGIGMALRGERSPPASAGTRIP